MRALLPVDEKLATASSAWAAVPIESEAPTAKILGSKAGFVSVPVLKAYPAFPVALTTKMPAFQACSTANASGSTWYACRLSVP